LRNVQLKSLSLFTKCPSLQRIHNAAAFVAPQREAGGGSEEPVLTASPTPKPIG
jgi:hypothetical protein